MLILFLFLFELGQGIFAQSALFPGKLKNAGGAGHARPPVLQNVQGTDVRVGIISVYLQRDNHVCELCNGVRAAKLAEMNLSAIFVASVAVRSPQMRNDKK